MKDRVCKYCGCTDLVLEPRIKGQEVMNADMCALKCSACGKWLKWCPKTDRYLYAKAKTMTNHEWLKSLNDDFLSGYMSGQNLTNTHPKTILIWLRSEHKEVENNECL